MRFHFKEINHVPGKAMYIADVRHFSHEPLARVIALRVLDVKFHLHLHLHALSRLQAQHADPRPTIADDEVTPHVASVITGLPISDSRLQQIIEVCYDPSVKVCENSKKLWKHSPAARVPTAFIVRPNFHSCLYNSIETRYMFSIS